MPLNMSTCRTIFLLLAILTSSCLAPADRDGHASESTQAERQIEEAFQQIVRSDGTPMDSLRLLFQKLERTEATTPLYTAKKDIIRATFHRKNGAFLLSKLYYHRALEHLDSTGDLAYTALSGLGIAYKHLGEFADAFAAFQKGIANSTARGDSLQMAGSYASLSQLYYEKDDTAQARKTIAKVFAILKDKTTERPYLIALQTLANVAAKGGNYKAAMQLAEKGIRLSQKAGNEAAKITFQDNLARCYLYGFQNYDRAAFYFRENLKIDKRLNNPNWIADTYINLAEVLTAEKQYPAAKAYLDSAIQIFTQSRGLNNSLRAYTALTNFYTAQGDYQKALQAQQAYETQYKKALNEKSEAAFAAYQVIYETEKKEKEIAEEKLKSQRKNLWLLLLGSLVVTGFFIFRNYRIKTRNRQQALGLENQLLRQETAAKMLAQRLDISRDLHDSLGAQLTFMHALLEKLTQRKQLTGEWMEHKISRLKECSQNAMLELRNTLWVLNREEIFLEDFKRKVLQFIHSASEAKEDIRFQTDIAITENIRLNSPQAVHLFRVIQELVNNAIKHADATEISVTVRQQPHLLTVQVCDNGKGFDAALATHQSYGLKNMESRMAAIGGALSFNTQPGQGAACRIIIET